MHNLLGVYRPDRAWSLSIYPRGGVNYNFGVSKGSLVVGIGMLNTYMLDERWSLYGDVAYMLTGSGFVGNNESGGTGTGSNSNGYFSIGLGAQYDLGSKAKAHKKGVLTNGFWNNWFVQAGIDISLMNPYGCNFSKVIPKGLTFGLDGAIGKWFTPEFGVRGRVNWENGLIENKNVEWVPPSNDPRQNYKGGGFASGSLDALLNLTNVIAGYQEDKEWHTNAFVRAGIITQFEMGSGSPLMGAGIEQTYRLNERLSLYGDVGYQVTTSEGMGVSTTGMDVAAGTNGFFNLEIGIIVDLGKNTWQ